MALVEMLLMHVSTAGALLAAVLLFVVVYLFSIRSRSPEDPPGLKPLPLLGNLHMFDLEKTYVSLWEALVNLSEEFQRRYISPIFHDFNQGYGIVFSNGENWKEMRRFALSNLRDFGMGKKRREELMIEETQHLKEEFEKFEGKPFETTLPVAMAVSNIISAIVYNIRFEYSNTKLHHMIKRTYENIKMIESASV